ncbi:hypothetical protein L210DRAFT_196399 [Boletus edulis BED1]|uniref:Uncharacterized protein n=1 Tax=Boletus edulis BED1 TaxID=1328754 RepID=A0AAD4BI98_BOLED|nr:hypothetical protein L210DRAFT_196399 [Boletus edulis BED1]
MFLWKDSVADPRPRRRRLEERVPYVHTLHGDVECLSTALSSHSTTPTGTVVPGATASGPPTSLSTGLGSKGTWLNLNVLAFAPSLNAISIGTGEGARVNL